jgi:hypothetical protein
MGLAAEGWIRTRTCDFFWSFMAHRPKLSDLISLCRSLSTNRLSIKHNKKSHSLICPVSMLPMHGASTVVVLGRFRGPSLTREDSMKWSQLTARIFRLLSAICWTKCRSVSNVSKTFPYRRKRLVLKDVYMPRPGLESRL